MNRTRMIRTAGAAVLAAGVAASFAVPGAAASPADSGKTADRATASPQMLTAMQRDLGLTAQEATERLAQEASASKLEHSLQRSLGKEFGGAYFDAGSGKLVVGVTEASAAAKARAAGATAKMVHNSAAELEAARSALVEHAESAPDAVTGWYVQNRQNSVVLTVKPGSVRAAKKFVAASGVQADRVRVVKSSAEPRLYQEQIVGGNAFTTPVGRCSIGFSVNGGFVTAGHCGNEGDATETPTGTFAGSKFPGNDYAWVESGAEATPYVKGEGGANVTVAGAQEAAEGASVCRSGSTTGWHCGEIQAKGQTVDYPEGTVNELTQTNVCAEPGDSGGSFIAGDQAQGMTSGGSGDCSSGGTTFFQPVNPALEAFGLTLVTG